MLRKSLESILNICKQYYEINQLKVVQILCKYQTTASIKATFINDVKKRWGRGSYFSDTSI